MKLINRNILKKYVTVQKMSKSERNDIHFIDLSADSRYATNCLVRKCSIIPDYTVHKQ